MTGERMRLDVFLWRTRFFKTRGGASDAIEGRGVRIERDGQVRRIDKSATPVAEGDLLSFAAHGGQKTIRVLSLPERRGPAPEAAMCYEAVGGASGRSEA